MTAIYLHVVILPTVLYAMQACLYANMALISTHSAHRDFLVSYALCAAVDMALSVCHWLSV